MAQSTPITLPWAQFGLAGLVIATLFGVLWKFGTRLIDTFETQIERLIGDHQRERGEWREGYEKQSEGMNNALSELTQAIRDNRKQ